MQFLRYVGFIIACVLWWIALSIFAAAKNVPIFIRNKFSRDKRTYWHPVDWMAQDEYDIFSR